MGKSKPLQDGILNEITVTIMHTSKKVNYHETFMVDPALHNHFEYKGKVYNMPPQDTGHYPISFWKFGTKLAIFYDHHKTLASLFDWFGFRNKGGYEIGYIYWEDNPEPEQLQHASYDWAMENYNLERNQTIEGSFQDADKRLQGRGANIGKFAMIGLIVIVIVAVIVVISILTSHGSAPVHPIQNVTGNLTG